MRKQIEHILLSILVGTSVLLGLTFWLNTNFGFNLFSSAHWRELASLQASGQQIDKNFYLSIGIALTVFIVCINIIFRPRFRKLPKAPEQNKPNFAPPAIIKQQPLQLVEPTEPNEQFVPETKNAEQPTQQKTLSSNIMPPRPPKLNLPKNMAQVVAAQYAQQQQNKPIQTDKYNDDLDTIFSENAFLVKKNPTISGFTPNLFAIGVNEIVWIGGVDCDIDKLNKAIQKLDSTFHETLEDITITINAFIIDTLGKYNSENKIHIFHNIDELKQYVSEHPGEQISDSDREDFDAYSDYIDTVLTLLYKI